MQTSSKIIFWTSVTFIFFLVIVPFVAQFTPLEFTDGKLRNSIEQFRFFGLPVIILLTLFGTLKSKDRPEIKIAKVVLTIVVSATPVLIFFAIAFGGRCHWTESKTLFEKNNEKTTKMVLREFGCGATDSGRPTYKVAKVKKVYPALIWVTDIDTTKIDRNTWQRIDKK